MKGGSLYGKLADAVRGLKTLIAAALCILLALADIFDVIPLQPLLGMVFGDNVAAKIMIVLPVLFGVLRLVSSGKVRFMRPKDEADPDQKEPF